MVCYAAINNRNNIAPHNLFNNLIFGQLIRHRADLYLKINESHACMLVCDGQREKKDLIGNTYYL